MAAARPQKIGPRNFVALVIFVAIPVFYGVTSEGLPGISAPGHDSVDEEP